MQRFVNNSAIFKKLFALVTISMTAVPLMAQQDLSSRYAWKPIKIGGTGFVTGAVSSATDADLRFARTDVGGFYRWNENQNAWTQLLTKDRFSDITTWQDEVGVESIALASDNKTVYAAAFDRVYRSTNGGESFAATNLSLPMEPNGITPSNGERLVVKPGDPNRAFFGSRESGLWQTSNGTSWSRAPGIADATDGVGFASIKYNHDGSKLYAATNSQGIYESTNDGASWTKITGDSSGPADSAVVTDIDIDGSGKLLASYENDGSNSGGIWSFQDGNWNQASPLRDRNFVTVSVDPFDNNRIIAATQGVQNFVISNDGGTTWRDLTFDRSSNDIPWAERTAESYFSTGEIYFDPSTRDRILTAQGIGFWKADVSESALSDNNVTFEFESKGIEELVTTDILARPGKPLVTFGWDRTGFVHSDLDKYNATQIFPDDFSIGWDGAFRRNDTDFIATTSADYLPSRGARNHAGFTTDGGATWQKFGSIENGTHPEELQYGAIAASNVSADFASNLVWLPATDGRPYFSNDNGTTWQQAEVWPTYSDGTDIVSGLFNRNFRYQGLIADVERAGAYFMTTSGGDLLETTDGGRSWEVLSTDLPRFGFNGQLEQNWIDPDTLWFAQGEQQNDPDGIYRSLDRGLSFSEVGEFSDAIDVSLGAAMSSNDPLSIYVLGTLSDQEGIYRSVDDGLSWEFLGQFPLGLLDQPLVLTADPDEFGRVYVGTSGTGFYYGEFSAVP
jgi:photosystem II stability/assembly factor-like uncharacterized protein